MKEVFNYPSNLKKEFSKEAKRRLGFWAIFVSPFWLFCPLFKWDDGGNIALLVSTFATVMVFLFELLLRDFARKSVQLCEQSLLYDGRRLIQLSPDGSPDGIH